MQYNKLVRDKVPEILRKEGLVPVCHNVEGDELRARLVNKLYEETKEFSDHWSVEELADLSEVIRALSEIIGSSPEQVEWERCRKAVKKGNFSQGIILEEVE